MFPDQGNVTAAVHLPPGPHRRLRLTVAYNGAGFRGFSPQAGLPTVGGSLAKSLATVFRLPVEPALTCAGRTDAGVHAWGQEVHVDLPAAEVDVLEPDALRRRLTKLLAPAIVVRAVSVVSDDFDARRSARWRRYRYTVLNDEIPDPFLFGRVWQVPEPLDLGAMTLACDAIVGTHDFASFCRKAPDGAPLVRQVMRAAWRATPELGPGLLRFEVTANAFCQQMVRSLVGTLVDVGRGRRRAGDMRAVMRARDRAQAGAVAPPDGLCLWEVGYPEGR